ncbi:uncharacterized protein LOC130933535 [Arachis stenosperma]|uniref:uncharacterized protein LOC130933535 n=1 Tax=Arachis stenosperma TaxID=217475 RepID=UPI0025AC9897|nr:uncharacterized protein LOC130933535 [Arachis stenosperma]
MADIVNEVIFSEPSTEDLDLMIYHLNEKIRCFLNENYDLESQVTILKAENDFLKDKLRKAETAVDLIEENKQLKAELKSLSKRKDNMWYMDSGCSRHMTGKSTFFINLDEYDGGFVTFGDNRKRKIVAIDDDAGSGTDVNQQANQENSKYVTSIESVCPETSLQNGGDISVLFREQARKSRTELPTETRQGKTFPQRPRE